MQHSDTRSEVGVIDTGDLVFVKEITERTDIIPYLDGRINNYRTYGSYGDVIIYKPNGNGTRTAIIHRAVIYIEFNSTNYDPLAMTGGSFDIPSMGRYDVDSSIVIDDYEWPMNLRSAGLVIDLRKILDNFRNYRTEPHGGYLTKGDDNPGVDHTSDFFNNDPPWISAWAW